MKNKNKQWQTFEMSVPLKLYKIIDRQAQQKFRTVAEEARFILTETLLSPVFKQGHSPFQLFDELMAHSEKQEARKNKTKTVKKIESNNLIKSGKIISLNKKRNQ